MTIFTIIIIIIRERVKNKKEKPSYYIKSSIWKYNGNLMRATQLNIKEVYIELYTIHKYIYK